MSRTKSVKVDNLANEVVDYLQKYTEDVQEGIKVACTTVAEDGRKTLEQVKQPSGTGGTARPMKRREWKKYAKGWKVKTDEKKNYVSSKIYNRVHQLTHLLEYGHITRNGTRTRAFKHIQPVEEECKEKFVKECEEVIKRGGK